MTPSPTGTSLFSDTRRPETFQNAVRLVLPCWFVIPRLAVHSTVFSAWKVRALWGPFATEGGGFLIVPGVAKYDQQYQ